MTARIHPTIVGGQHGKNSEPINGVLYGNGLFCCWLGKKPQPFVQ